MKPRWPLLDPTQLKDDFGSWRSGLVFPVQSALQEMRAFMTNGITFADNMNAAIIEFDAVHGTEALFTPPDKIKVPLTFIPISAALPSNAGFINIASKSQINYQPLMSTGAPRTDGRLGITVNYAPLSASGGGFIENIVPVGSKITGFVSGSGKNITSFSVPAGDWELTGLVQVDGTLTGIWIIAGIGPTTPAPNRGDGAVSTPTMPTASIDVSLVVPAYRVLLTTAATYFLICSVNFSAGTPGVWGRMQARQIAPDPATTARVRGILVGG